MDNVFMGKIVGSCSRISEEDGKRCASIYFHDTESNACSKLSHYNKTYSLVLSDDVIKTNDELLKLRDEMKELEEAYKNEKIAGEMLLKDRDALKEKVEKLEAEKKRLTDTSVYWNNRFTSVMTDFSKILAAKGIEFSVKNIDNYGNWDVVIDIPELNEAKKEITKLKRKLKAVESERDSLDIQNESLQEVIDSLKNKIKRLEDDNSAKDDRGDHWKRNYETLSEYWDNTYKGIVDAGKKVGVKIEIEGRNSDRNAGNVCVTNEKTIEFMVKLNDTKQKHDKKWQAMTDALKDKSVEVIYMGEEDGKPIVDVKIPAIDILRKDYIVRGQTIEDLKKEIKELKSDKIATCTLEADDGGRLKFIYTYMDGHNEAASFADLCKNYVAIDAESLSHGTVPKCSSCAHYMHNPSRFAHDWCYKPVSKEGPGTIRRLSTEEAEGPACSDFKARKE